jgi:hypothetical protein
VKVVQQSSHRHHQHRSGRLVAQIVPGVRPDSGSRPVNRCANVRERTEIRFCRARLFYGRPTLSPDRRATEAARRRVVVVAKARKISSRAHRQWSAAPMLRFARFLASRSARSERRSPDGAESPDVARRSASRTASNSWVSLMGSAGDTRDRNSGRISVILRSPI